MFGFIKSGRLRCNFEKPIYTPSAPFQVQPKRHSQLKKTIVSLLIVILTCSIALPLMPTVTSQVSTVQVLDYTYYYDSIGFLVVVGEIQNQGPNIIESIILTGTISDSNGLQTNSYTTVWGHNLLPNQKAVFYMEFQPRTQDNEYLADVSNVNINVYKADPTSSYQYPDLAIISQQSYIGSNPGSQASTDSPGDGDLGVYWVTGTIQNTGTETAQKRNSLRNLLQHKW